MPVYNIVDRRTNDHNFYVDAIFEPTFHDNSIEGATMLSQQMNFSTIKFMTPPSA